VYQIITGRYSPVNQVKNKIVRVAIFAAIFSALFGYQVYDYMQGKKENLYEMLELETPYVSSHQIEVGFKNVKEKYNPEVDETHKDKHDRIVSAHKCLKRKRCRD